MNKTIIWTDDEALVIDLEDVSDLERAMRFKAEHIKAKADPCLFIAVADLLKEHDECTRVTYIN